MSSISKLLVPVDFSENSMHALRYAMKFAWHSDASVTLLHVVTIKGSPHARLYSDKLPEIMKENAKSDFVKIIQAVKNEFQTNLPLDYIILKDGMVANAIVKYASVNHFDLIVMGTKGASGLKEIIMGSITASTIRKTKVPVMAIPHEYSIEEPDTILFATNHFEENIALLNTIATLAKLFFATIHVAVFVDTLNAKTANCIYNFRQLKDYLNFLKNSFPDIVFKGELLEGVDFEETVEKYDTTNGVDIIAMITYRRNLCESILQKSTTRNMAFHSKIPILAIPSK